MADATQFQARPTVYKGVKMRSRLEADFARQLDASGTPWEYEPKCFASGAGQYLPDFGVLLNEDEYRYVEVKPGSLNPDEIDDALRRMEIIWASEPDALLTLFLWEHRDYSQDLDRAAFIDGKSETEPDAASWWCNAGLVKRWWPSGPVLDVCVTDEYSGWALWPGMGQWEQLVNWAMAGVGEA
jgi:hypothetical protein